MPAICIYKSTITYPAVLLLTSAIAFSTLYCKALPATRKKSSFFSITVRSNYFGTVFIH